jgi:hypothetical protein
MLQEGPNLLGNHPETDGEIQYFDGRKILFHVFIQCAGHFEHGYLIFYENGF